MRKMFISPLEFDAVKWKNLEFICSDGICKCLYAIGCVFLHKVKQRLAFSA